MCTILKNDGVKVNGVGMTSHILWDLAYLLVMTDIAIENGDRNS